MRGIEKLAETVAVTLGPRGRNVLLDKASMLGVRKSLSGLEPCVGHDPSCCAATCLAARALVQGEFSAPQIVNDGVSLGFLGGDTFALAS